MPSPDALAGRPDRLARLHAACFTRPRPWSATEFAGLLAAPDTLLADAPDGFGLTRVTLDEAELLTLAVAPAARGQGLGTRLLAELMARAAARGAAAMLLEVAADNTAARVLYARAGFVEIGRRRGYYGGTDALVLRAPLTGG
ncbi:MAG: ribosomal protein S18-alanine N-acetyltransferase [Alkalilacustris sp.]